MLGGLPRGVYRATTCSTTTASPRAASRSASRSRSGTGAPPSIFAGTAPQVEGSVNANYAVTLSAVLYAFPALAAEPIPPNDGRARVHRGVERRSAASSTPSFPPPSPVATSRRRSGSSTSCCARSPRAAPDRIPAASAGSMNNVAVGGFDRRRGRAFSYYETIAGGAGARAAAAPGASGVHTHMTNTLNTPIEALEAYYPFRVTEYRFRRRQLAGAAIHVAATGLVREIELLEPCDVTLLTDAGAFRRRGLAGGGPGRPAATICARDGVRRRCPSKMQSASRGPAMRYDSRRQAAAAGARGRDVRTTSNAVHRDASVRERGRSVEGHRIKCERRAKRIASLAARINLPAGSRSSAAKSRPSSRPSPLPAGKLDERARDRRAPRAGSPAQAALLLAISSRRFSMWRNLLLELLELVAGRHVQAADDRLDSSSRLASRSRRRTSVRAPRCPSPRARRASADRCGASAPARSDLVRRVCGPC